MNIGALLAGLMSGIIGGMGLGGGAVLIIYLTVFKNVEQLRAQGINLLFFVPIATLAVIIYSFKKQIKWRVTLPLAIGGLIGAIGGFFLTDILGGNFTSKLFGGFLIFLGIKELFTKSKKGT
ncbi:MAG: TSUP family transporter [Clostridia bacterium]|nr:TSUP family transporter [Clostridia bacterium]